MINHLSLKCQKMFNNAAITSHRWSLHVVLPTLLNLNFSLLLYTTKRGYSSLMWEAVTRSCINKLQKLLFRHQNSCWWTFVNSNKVTCDCDLFCVTVWMHHLLKLKIHIKFTKVESEWFVPSLAFTLSLYLLQRLVQSTENLEKYIEHSNSKKLFHGKQFLFLFANVYNVTTGWIGTAQFSFHLFFSGLHCVVKDTKRRYVVIKPWH